MKGSREAELCLLPSLLLWKLRSLSLVDDIMTRKMYILSKLVYMWLIGTIWRGDLNRGMEERWLYSTEQGHRKVILTWTLDRENFSPEIYYSSGWASKWVQALKTCLYISTGLTVLCERKSSALPKLAREQSNGIACSLPCFTGPRRAVLPRCMNTENNSPRHPSHLP